MIFSDSLLLIRRSQEERVKIFFLPSMFLFQKQFWIIEKLQSSCLPMLISCLRSSILRQAEFIVVLISTEPLQADLVPPTRTFKIYRATIKKSGGCLQRPRVMFLSLVTLVSRNREHWLICAETLTWWAPTWKIKIYTPGWVLRFTMFLMRSARSSDQTEQLILKEKKDEHQ